MADLSLKEALTEEDRETVHKLSGTAAVLGQTDLWEVLQAVQHCDNEDWLDDKELFLDTLNALKQAS